MLLKAGVVLTAGPLLYAACLFLVEHLRGLRAAVVSIGFSVITGLYWTGLAFFLLGVTAGDARDGVAPDFGPQRAILLATLILAPIIYAFMLSGWRRLVRRNARGTLTDA